MFRFYHGIKAKALLACLFSVLFCISMTGCSNAKFSLSQFAKGEQSFAFPKTEWGMSVAEVEKAVGYTLGKEPVETDTEETDFRADTAYTGFLVKADAVEYLGLKGMTTFQFSNGHLWAAGITWLTPSDGNKKLDQLLAEAQKTFGAETSTEKDKVLPAEINPDSNLTVTSYTWGRDNAKAGSTKVSLSATKKDGEVTSIDFGVAQFPIQSE